MWSRLGFSDPVILMAKNSNYQHDITCLTVVVVVLGMGFFLLSVFVCSFWSKCNKENQKVEFWLSLLPGVWLSYLSYFSLGSLYMMESEGHVSETAIGVVGHQWNWEYSYGSPVSGGFPSGLPGTCSLGVGKEDLVEFSYISHMKKLSELEEGDFRLMEVDRRLVLPLSKTLLSVTSADVVHSWSVPSLGVKVEAVPGKSVVVGLNPKRCGVSYGSCAEICGVNHSYMPISVEVLTEEFFAKWLSQTSNFLFSGGGNEFDSVVWAEDDNEYEMLLFSVLFISVFMQIYMDVLACYQDPMAFVNIVEIAAEMPYRGTG